MCPVHASNPFVVLPCQPAYLFPVLLAASLVRRADGMLKLYHLPNRPHITAALYVKVMRSFSADVFGAFAYQVSCKVSVSFLQPYA